jgi:hypothetical protein
MKILFTFVTKQATLTWRSSVQSIPLQLVFPALAFVLQLMLNHRSLTLRLSTHYGAPPLNPSHTAVHVWSLYVHTTITMLALVVEQNACRLEIYGLNKEAFNFSFKKLLLLRLFQSP